MAEITVFVDDAVRGTLPGVCVKDGVSTADRLVMRQDIGGTPGLGVAWLLLLAGPLGWLGLVLISNARRGELLSVQVPMSEVAYQRLRAARRRARDALIAGALAFVVALGTLPPTVASPGDSFGRSVIALVACLALVVALITRFTSERRVQSATIEVDLDASRRWVTLSRVHPAFVAACQAREQRQVERT